MISLKVNVVRRMDYHGLLTIKLLYVSLVTSIFPSACISLKMLKSRERRPAGFGIKPSLMPFALTGALLLRMIVFEQFEQDHQARSREARRIKRCLARSQLMILLKLLSLKLRVDGSIASKDISERGVREGENKEGMTPRAESELSRSVHSVPSSVPPKSYVCFSDKYLGRMTVTCYKLRQFPVSSNTAATTSHLCPVESRGIKKKLYVQGFDHRNNVYECSRMRKAE